MVLVSMITSLLSQFQRLFTSISFHDLQAKPQKDNKKAKYHKPTNKAAAKPGRPGVKPKKKKVQLKFVIDCSHPVEDGIMNAGDRSSSSS